MKEVIDTSKFYKNEYHAINSIQKRIKRKLTDYEESVILFDYAKSTIRCELPILRGFWDCLFEELKNK